MTCLGVVGLVIISLVTFCAGCVLGVHMEASNYEDEDE